MEKHSESKHIQTDNMTIVIQTTVGACMVAFVIIVLVVVVVVVILVVVGVLRF